MDISTAQTLLRGKRVLLLEDSNFLGEIFLEMLQEVGCQVVGPFQRVEDATIALESMTVDAAVMDVCIQGDRSFDLAEQLLTRQVPVLLVSGYGSDTVPEKFRTNFIQKPFDEIELVTALCGTIFKRAWSRAKPAPLLAAS